MISVTCRKGEGDEKEGEGDCRRRVEKTSLRTSFCDVFRGYYDQTPTSGRYSSSPEATVVTYAYEYVLTVR
jgi:hypothetical protein